MTNHFINLHSSTTLNNPKMAPTVEQVKNNGNDDLVIEHSDEHYASNETSSSRNNSEAQSFVEKIKKPRKTACTLCHTFVGNTKLEYYDHLRTMHEASGKLLHCRLCPFIALHRHHLDYHLRQHDGSKPYKCDKCGYSCVNQSMLNSHYKSHFGIQQYSCKNCSYMTKYLHSLKQHLRKHNHEPGRTLNPDGTVNDHTIIDVHGKRRGPKSKKRKSETDLLKESSKSPKSSSSPSPPSTSNQLPSQNIRILYNPQIYNNHNGNLYARSEPSKGSSYKVPSPPNIVEYPYKCPHCEFVSRSCELYHYHMFSHVHENQTSAGNFPFYAPQHIDLLFAAHYGSDSFWKSIINQPTAAEPRKIYESSRRMHATKNDFYTPSSSSAMNREPLENTHLDKKESSLYGMAISPQMSPINDYQYPKLISQKRNGNGIKSSTPSPNAAFTVKDETPKTMNEISNNFNDNAPLDLSLKQPSSPETKSNGSSSPFSQSSGATMDRESAVSPKSEYVVIRGPNRRKGRAFKLNQYTVENDSISDGFENELFTLQR